MISDQRQERLRQLTKWLENRSLCPVGVSLMGPATKRIRPKSGILSTAFTAHWVMFIITAAQFNSSDQLGTGLLGWLLSTHRRAHWHAAEDQTFSISLMTVYGALWRWGDRGASTISILIRHYQEIPASTCLRIERSSPHGPSPLFRPVC